MRKKKINAAWTKTERPKSFQETGRLTKTSGQKRPGGEVDNRGGSVRNKSATLRSSWGQRGCHSTSRRGSAMLSRAENRSICAAVARCCILRIRGLLG